MESELLRFDKELEKVENEINELSSHEEKSVNKEKKYLMQIDNYNKKIDNGKQDLSKLTKSITLLKKEIKSIESVLLLLLEETVTFRTEKNKIEQVIRKEQAKINTFTQTINDLKLKLSEQSSQQSQKPDNFSMEREEKQIGELFNAIKKQMALIDVLKRQKVHLIAATVFKYCEESFDQVLEMNKNQ